MNYLLLAMLGLSISKVHATADDPLITTAQIAGIKVYTSCIVNPPHTLDRKVICDALYSSYNAALSAVNAPLPLAVSVDPTQYSWSPYDVCRYEAGHVVFSDGLSLPYCPSI